MAEDRWNDGRQYGLPPIGLPHADLSTPGSDTERRAFPGLATKSSVFAWNTTFTTIQSQISVSAGWSDVVNLRRNTASGGSSVDVPTWAAGAVVACQTTCVALGAGITYQSFRITCPVVTGGNYLFIRSHDSAAGSQIDQVIIPFFDEPIFTIDSFNSASSALGTVTCVVRLVGFVRNV